MLTLTRRESEAIRIGSDVEVVVLGVSRGRVRIGIRAPRETPIYRSELVAEIEAQNRRAANAPRDARKAIASEETDADAIHFPDGLLGLGEHDEFLLCELGEADTFKALVSRKDTAMQLVVVEARDVWPDFPVAEAHEAAARALPELAGQEVAVAAVVTLPIDGGTPTVNLAAPLVIGLGSRHGVQVILDREELGLVHALTAGEAKGRGTAKELPSSAPEVTP